MEISDGLVEGKQLDRVHRGQHGNAAAVPQLLHGGHVLLGITPHRSARFSVFFFGESAVPWRRILPVPSGPMLFLDLALDLALQQGRDPALDHRDPFLQLPFQRLGGGFLLFCVRQLLFVLIDGLGESLSSLLCRLAMLVLLVAAEAGYTVAVSSRQTQASPRLTARDQLAAGGFPAGRAGRYKGL